MRGHRSDSRSESRVQELGRGVVGISHKRESERASRALGKRGIEKEGGSLPMLRAGSVPEPCSRTLQFFMDLSKL
jgi:hypothetical protein